MSVTITNPKATLLGGAIIVSEIDGSPLIVSTEKIKFSNNSVTDNGDGSVTVVTGVGGGGDTSTNTAVSVDGEVVLFSGTGGKTLKRSTLTGLLKSTAGVLQVASAGTDYAPATSGHNNILMGDGAGGFVSAVAGTDYAPVTSGSSILKGDGAGGFSAAVAGTDFLAINGNGSQLTNMTKSQVGLGNVDNTSDANKPISSATQTALNLKANAANPVFTGNIRSTLLGNENFLIDARTTPCSITLGVLRIEHTAGISGTRPITLDIDANGYGNTHALVVDYKATNIGTSENHILELNVDTELSTGGNIQAVSVSKIGSGLVDVTAVETLQGVNVVTQRTGDPIVFTQAWKLSGAVYTDVTSAFGNGTDVSIFSNDNDYIICGYNSVFQQIEINLTTKSSHPIDAIFEYSTGNGTWATFTPTDGTNGFTNNGNIMWTGALSGWASSLVNGVSKYYIRIQRTKNLITTPPVEKNIRILSNVDFGWDKNADVKLRKIKATGLPVYIDRAAALTGGLVTGDFYQKSDGTLMVV